MPKVKRARGSYWEGTGALQVEKDSFCKLVPVSGACATIAGEMMRAATKIEHECYNNGFGNDITGATKFLVHSGVIAEDDPDWKIVYSRSSLGGSMGRGTGRVYAAVESLLHRTVEHIIRNPHLKDAPNKTDMWDLSDPVEWSSDDEEWSSDEED